MNFITICETCQTCNNNSDLIFCRKLDKEFFQNIYYVNYIRICYGPIYA